MPDIVGLENHKPTSLGAIAQRAAARKDHRFQDLYGLLDAGLLWQCWDDLDINPNAARSNMSLSVCTYRKNFVFPIRE